MKKNSMRLLWFLMAVVMVASLLTVGIFAEDTGNPVAKIGETGYASFEDALGAATESDTITLLKDIANLDVTISKAITLDLGGKTVTDAYIKVAANVTIQNGSIKNTTESYPLVINGGTLTVENVAIEASKSDRAIWLKNSGTTLSFNSGSILATKGENNTRSKIYGVWVCEGATANINGGTITVDAGANATAVAIFGNYDNTVNVTGGKISTSGSNYSYAIWVDGDVTVTGGEIVTNEKCYGYSSGITYGKNYAINSKGDVEISGGKITTNGPSGYLVNADGSNQEITISDVEFTNVMSEADTTAGGHKAPNLIYGSSVTATITGGSFEGVSATLIKGTGSTLEVSGGSFDVDVSEYLAEGSKIVEKEDGTFEAYVPPKGNDFTGYTGGDAIWGKAWGNAKESFVIKVLDANGNVMGTTSLNNIGGIIDGDVNVTWSLKLDAASNTDAYWTMAWTTAPTVDNMPAKVELWVDGVKVSGGNVVLNGPDDLNKIYAAVADEDGKILGYYTSVSAAISAVGSEQKVCVLQNVTISGDLVIPEGVTLDTNGKTINVSGKVTNMGTIVINGGELKAAVVSNMAHMVVPEKVPPQFTEGATERKVSVSFVPEGATESRYSYTFTLAAGASVLDVPVDVLPDGKYNCTIVDFIDGQTHVILGTTTIVNGAIKINGGALTVSQTLANNYGTLAITGESELNLTGAEFNGNLLIPNANLTINGGTITNDDKSVSGIEINAGELILNNVTVKSARHALRIDGDVTVVINGGYYQGAVGTGTGTYHALHTSNGAFVTIANGTFVGPKGDPNTTADSGSAVNVGSGCIVIINGGSFSGGKSKTLQSAGTLTVEGGIFDQDPSAYVTDYKKAVKKDGDVYTIVPAVASIGNKGYASLIEALLAATQIESNETVVIQLMTDVREQMPTDVELRIKSNVKLVSATGKPVDAKFYNAGTSYDFIINSADGFNGLTFTIGENVTFQLEDRIIWSGYYGNNVTVVVDGTLAGSQYWNGANTIVNSTGILKSTGEALVMRRGATITVNGGKVQANYFNILSGNIIAENATIECGAFWIANTGNYANEGNVKISLKNSVLTSTGNLKSNTAHANGVSIELINSTVEFNDFDGYGACILDAKTILTVNGGTLKAASLTNNGAIEVKGESTLKIDTLTGGKNVNFLDGSVIKDSTIGGGVFVAGNVIFRGDNVFTMLYDYGTLTDYYGTTAPMAWTVEKGASVTLTDKSRYGLGYGDKIVIYGDLDNALTARENLPAEDIVLYMHGMVAQESMGWNCNSSLTVNNAYVVIGNNNSFGNKPGNYGGSYTITFNNSVLDGSRITFYEALSKTIFTFDKSDVKIGTFMTNDADSEFYLIDSKVLSTTTTNGKDEANRNAGLLSLKNSFLTYSCEFTNDGTVELHGNSKLTAPKIVNNGKIVIDVTGLKAGEYAGFEGEIVNNGTIEVIGNDELYAVVENGKIVLVKYVAKIEKDDGNVYYCKTLQEAINNVANGETITLIWAEGDAPIAMNGSVYGKTVTITGTATVDWSKGFLFIGRGGEGNGTVIFNNAILTSASNQASTGIHVSGREKNTNNKYDGTLIIENSTIELDYLINKGTMTLDNSTLTVKNGFSIGGRPASETEDGKDATATITLNNGSKVVVNNHNGMGLGYEAIGVMNVNSGSTFETTQSFLITAKGTLNVNGGTVKVAGTLTNKGSIVIDATGMTACVVDSINATVEMSGGTVTAINNKYVYADVNNDGRIVLVNYVAMIGDQGYKTLAEAIKAAQADDIVTLLTDVTIAATAGGYSKAGVIISGEILDGNGHTLTVTGANSTWDCGIYITGGTVKNITVKGAFRGIFTAGASADIYLDKVNFENVVYTFNSDDGNKQYGVYISNSTINGWTSFSDVHKEVVFTKCSFGEGSGYAFCRPYNTTVFNGCTFSEGYEIDGSQAQMEFQNMDKESVSALVDGAVAIIARDNDVTTYVSLETAIAAAQNGDTITLLVDCDENVTVEQAPDVAFTIDGNYKIFTGTITVDGKSAAYETAGLTIKNVKFDATNISKDACINLGVKGNNNTRYTSNVTVENCTFTGNANKVAIKQYTGGCENLTITGCKATDMHSLAQFANVETSLVISGCTVTGKRGLSLGNSTNVTISNSVINAETYGIRADGDYVASLTVKDTTVKASDPIVVRKTTADYGLTLTGTNDLTATNANGYAVTFTSGDDGTYIKPEGSFAFTNNGNDVKVYPVAEYQFFIGAQGYLTFADALAAVQNGDTITLKEGATGSELTTEIDFTKAISFTITGTAPEYALPVITFQNATVTIENAEILIPELDARQNATINVKNSIVHDAGGNSIIKSYYNGAINISDASKVYTMQVTTMGYITISGGAELHATWQTNVYGNGMIVVKNGAVFNTAALHLTGKDYSGRDNTDADRVGKPATIVVDGATFTVGKVKSDNGADYSYNSSEGINVGTIAGKAAVLDIKNRATVNIYMADGETANIGADGTVNVDGSTFIVACRKDGGAAKLTNLGKVNITDSTVEISKLDNDYLMFLNGTVTIKTDASGSSYAIRCNDGVVFNNSYIKGTANETVRLLGSATFNGGFECAYLQGSSAGVGGTVTIENGTTVKATYGVEFSNDYDLNGGTIELSGGNASGKLWGCVFQSGTYEINTNIVVDGNGKTAPIHFTEANATINSSITQKNSGGEPLYIANTSVVTLGTDAVIDALSIHGAGKLIIDASGMTAGEYANIKCGTSGFTGTLEVVKNTKLYAENKDGKIVLVQYVAMIGEQGYKTLQDALNAAQDGDSVFIFAGSYAQDLNINKDITVIGETTDTGYQLVAIYGRVNVTADGATVKGLYVYDDDTGLYINAKDVLIENCEIVGASWAGLYQSYTTGTVTFQDCVIVGAAYAINFDGSEGGNIVIDGCKIQGWTSFASTIGNVSINDTEFVDAYYNLLRFYQNAEITNTVFPAGMRIDSGNKGVGMSGIELKFTGCSMADGSDFESVFPGSVITTSDIYVNDEKLVRVAKIGNDYYETLADAVAAAQDGDEIVILSAGTYKVPTGKNITITGAVDGVVFDMSKAVGVNASMTFNNVTFNYGNSNYKGLQHAGTMVYNNCTINGQVTLYGASETFNNCTFNQTSAGAYNVWTYGAKEVAFNECTFNSAGKSVLIYAEGASITNDVSFTKCTLNASAPADGKAAIEMDSSLIAGITLTIDAATTATGFGTGNVSGNSLWNNKKGNNTDANNDITVVVNGETVLAPVTFVAKIGEIGYTSLADALAAAKDQKNIVIDLVADATLDITAWDTLAIGGDTTETITINGNGKTLTFNKLNSDWNHIITKNDAKLILNNVTLADSGKNNGPWNRYDINFACDVELNNVISNKALAFKADAQLTDVTVNETGDNYAIWIQANGQTVTIDGLTVNSAGRGIKIDEQYVGTPAKITLSVEDATFNTEKKAAILVKSAAGADIALNNVDIAGVTADTVNAVWVDADAAQYFGLVTVTGDTKAQEDVTEFAASLSVNGEIMGYYKTLQAAINACVAGNNTITLLVDSAEDVTIKQTEGVNITIDGNGIDGNGKKYSGTITIHGAARYTGAETLTIQNVNFVTDKAGHYFIDSNSTASAERYAHNVTVKDCIFTATGAGVNSAAAMRIRQGFNISIENVTATGLHSLFQGYGCSGLVITDVTVTGKNGISVGTSTDVTISGADITATGYGIRVDASVNTTLTIDNSTINAYTPVVVREATASGYAIDFDTTNMTAGNGNYYVVVGKTEYEAGKNLPVDASYAVKITGLSDDKIWQPLEGTGTEKDPYRIENLDDLIFFRNAVNAGDTKYNGSNVYVVLADDIDLASIDNWAPIGTFDYSFDGNFNGKGHKIMNLKMSDNTAANGYAYLGFFGVTANNTIENLVIKNVTINSNGQIVAAAIAYPYYTTVKNITVCGNIAIKGGNYTAGVLGYTRLCENASNLTVSGNAGSYITGAIAVGGVVADIQMNNDLTANYSNFSVSGLTITGDKCVGGITGIIGAETLNGATVKNVTLVSSDSRVGIVAGSLGTVATIKNVTASKVTGATAIIGGAYNGGAAIQAKIGDTYYATFAYAYAAAQKNDTIVILSDLTITETLVISKDITLDLNNAKLTGMVYPVIRVTGNATVTVTNGYIVNNDYIFVLGASDGSSAGNLIIKDGYYVGETTIASVTKGTLTILGGTFKCLDGEYGSTYLLNCIDANYKNGAEILVKGGTFYGFDPKSNAAEGANTSFMADGYCTVAGANGVYFAVEHSKEILPAVDPTCMTPGLSEGVKCNHCGTILVKQTEKPTKEHTNVTVTYGGNCVENGFTYTYCSVCEKMIKKPEVIKATGHKYEVVVGDNTNGYTIYKCTACGHSYVDDTLAAEVIITVNGIGYTNWDDAAAAINAVKKGEICDIVFYKDITIESYSIQHEAGTIYNIDMNGYDLTVNTLFHVGSETTLNIADSAAKNGTIIGNFRTGNNSTLHIAKGINFNGKLDMMTYGGTAGHFFIGGNYWIGDRGIFTLMTDAGSVSVEFNDGFMELELLGGHLTLTESFNTKDKKLISISSNSASSPSILSIGKGVTLTIDPETTFNVGRNGYMNGEGAVEVNTLEQFLTVQRTDIKNIVLGASLVIEKDMTLDLSGKTITTTGDAFIVKAGTLTLNGDGVVKAGTSGVGSWCAVWADGGHVIINGGTYSVGGDTEATDRTHQNDVIYTKNGGTVVINGGTFLNDGTVWTLNRNDSTGGTITVYGGTFQNWNPKNNVSEGANTSFVADGYFSIHENGNYVVAARLLGDVSGDGRIDTLDITRLLDYTAKKPVEIDLSAADVDGNGKVNATDISYMINYVTGRITKFPAQK